MICQEKERILADSQTEYSHLKTKVKLLEEVLIKRNEEYNELSKKYRKTVFCINTVQVIIEDNSNNNSSECSMIIKKFNMSSKSSHNKIQNVTSGKCMYKNTKYNENSLDDSSNDKVLGKLDPEILFPTQLKSYYASAVF